MNIQNVLYEAPGPHTKKLTRIATLISFFLLSTLLVVIVRRFYNYGQFEVRYWSFFLKGTTWRFLANGLYGTIKAALTAAGISFLLGFLMLIGKIGYNSMAQKISAVLVEFTRGVPTLLFIYFFFLVVPQYGIKLPNILKIALPVAISASGTVAETLRSGVNAVPRGQREAGLCLGMRERHVFLKIIFPQAMRYVVPALITELVIVLKDTTFAYVVNYPDLMQNAKVLISNYDAMLQVYLVITVIYILINYFLNKLSVFFANRRITSIWRGR